MKTTNKNTKSAVILPNVYSNDEYRDFKPGCGMPEILHYISSAHESTTDLFVSKLSVAKTFGNFLSPAGVEGEDLSSDACVTRITSHLNQLEQGRLQKERRLLPYHGVKSEAIQKWQEQLDKSLASNKVLLSFEQQYYGKCGPQGQIHGIRHESVHLALERYYAMCGNKFEHLIDSKFLNQLYDFASTLGAEMSSKYGKVTPMSLKEVLSHITDRGMDTRTGAPLYYTKADPRACLYSLLEAERIVVCVLEDPTYDKHSEYVLGLRDLKLGLRCIFMEPFSDTLIAGQWTVPLLKYLVNTGLPEFMGWTDRVTVRGVAFNKFRKENAKAWPKAVHFMSDFSKMDTNVRAAVVELSYLFIKELMPVDYTEAEFRLLKFSLSSLYKAPLRVQDKWVITSNNHGALSGSSWIQMVETIQQYVMYEFLLRNTQEVLDGGKKMGLGPKLKALRYFLSLIGDDSGLTILGLINSAGHNDPNRIQFILSGVEHCDRSRDRNYLTKSRSRTDGTNVGVIAGSLAEVWTNMCKLLNMPCELSKQKLSFEAVEFCKHLTRTASRALLLSNDMDANEIGSYRLETIYPTILALNSILYPESLNSDWTAEQDFGRIIQILDGTYDHPLHKLFVEFVAKGHPTDLFRRCQRCQPMMSLDEFDGVIYRLQKVIDKTHPKQYTWYTADGYRKIYYKDSVTVKYLRETLDQYWATRQTREATKVVKPALTMEELLEKTLGDLD